MTVNFPAAFEKAFPDMIAQEGGYVNDPADSGGETYKGVSRNNFPHWPGWKMIDSLKAKGLRTAKALNAALADDAAMLDMVKSFYMEEFWRKTA